MEPVITFYKKDKTANNKYRNIASAINQSIDNIKGGHMEGGICHSQISRSYFTTDYIVKTSDILVVVTANSPMRARLESGQGVTRYGEYEKTAQEIAAKTGVSKPSAIWGFAICSDEEDEHKDTYLYVDLLCASTEDKSGIGRNRVSGKYLIEQLQQHVVNENFKRQQEPYKGIKLSSLASIITYYRKFGFAFIKKHGDKEDAEIENMLTKITEKYGKYPFRVTSEEAAQGETPEMKVESLLKKEYHTYIADKEDVETSYKQLPEFTMLKFMVHLVLSGFSKKCNTPQIKERVKREGFFITVGVDEDEDEEYSEQKQEGGDSVSPPVSQTILYGDDYTPPSPDDLPLAPIRKDDTSEELDEAEEELEKWDEEHKQAKEESLEFSCTEQGFDMILPIETIEIFFQGKESNLGEGPLEDSISGKTKSKTRKSSASKPNKTKKNSKAMTNREVKNMRRACGKKCFYDEKLKYPVCKPKTCKIDKRRLKRAFKKRTQTRKHKKISEKTIIKQAQSQSQSQSQEKSTGILATMKDLFTIGKKPAPAPEPPLLQPTRIQEEKEIGNKRNNAVKRLEKLATAHKV